jgi:hypothetical protein
MRRWWRDGGLKPALRVRDDVERVAQGDESFLVLFFKKEPLVAAGKGFTWRRRDREREGVMQEREQKRA